MITSKVVLKNKFWILQEDGVSIGHLRFEHNNISAKLNKENYLFSSIAEAKKKLHIKCADEAPESAPQFQFVYEYQTDLEQVFNIHKDNGLPCYTKTKNSKVVYSAGWYGMHRIGVRGGVPGAHAETFCPKVNTLRAYSYIGPFKNQTDLKVAITSWKRNEQQGSISLKQVSS